MQAYRKILSQSDGQVERQIGWKACRLVGELFDRQVVRKAGCKAGKKAVKVCRHESWLQGSQTGRKVSRQSKSEERQD